MPTFKYVAYGFTHGVAMSMFTVFQRTKAVANHFIIIACVPSRCLACCRAYQHAYLPAAIAHILAKLKAKAFSQMI